MPNITKKSWAQLYPDIPYCQGINLSYPSIITNDNQYLKTIQGQFFDYVLLLEDAISNQRWLNKKVIDSIRASINETAKTIVESYNFFVNGRIDDSIVLMRKLIQSHRDVFVYKLGESYAIKCNNFYYKPHEMATNVYMYRGRKIIALKSNTCPSKELFHIPFDKREKVAGDRYSISGTPCLYLACNTFVAQCELHVNNLSNNSFYSAFKPSTAFLNKRIIDLSVPDSISDISSGPTYSERGVVKLQHKEITEILKKSPAHLLNIACMVKCKEKNRNFKSEYVIPQLIMCCLKKMHCVGVAYESTCFSQNIHMLKSCFAFPAFQQQKSTKQYSKQLANAFKMTKGNSASFFHKNYSSLSQNKTNSHGLFNNMYINQSWAFYKNGHPYYKTENYAFDEFLISKTFKKLHF